MGHATKIGTLLASVGVLLASSGCRSTVVEIEVESGLFRVKVKLTPVSGCGEGARYLGWVLHEGKNYQAFDSNGDGCPDCVVDPVTGRAYAATVLEGNPCDVKVTPRRQNTTGVAASPELEQVAERQNVLEVDLSNLLQQPTADWRYRFISLAATEVLDFNMQTGIVDLQLGFDPGTLLVSPSGYNIDSGFQRVRMSNGDQVSVYRLRGHVADVYWFLQDSIGGNEPLDFSFHTTSGTFEFDGEVDSVTIFWEGLQVLQEERP